MDEQYPYNDLRALPYRVGEEAAGLVARRAAGVLRAAILPHGRMDIFVSDYGAIPVPRRRCSDTVLPRTVMKITDRGQQSLLFDTRIIGLILLADRSR